jgi:hypothetical protein
MRKHLSIRRHLPNDYMLEGHLETNLFSPQILTEIQLQTE